MTITSGSCALDYIVPTTRSSCISFFWE